MTDLSWKRFQHVWWIIEAEGGGLAAMAAVPAEADGQMSHEISHPLHKGDDLET